MNADPDSTSNAKQAKVDESPIQRAQPTQPIAPPTPFPNVSDANYRVTCNEIAEQLSKNWRFKLHVSGLVVTAFITLAAAIGALVGWSLSTALANQRQRFEEDVKKEIGTARGAIEKQIAEEFKKENVQKTVQAAAASEASRLLATSVDPSIKSFQAKIDTVTAQVDKRSTELENVVRKSESAATDIENLRGELARLKRRNDITALADLAISQGDVEAYRKLEELTSSAPTAEDRNALLSELVRVYQSYSVFSGVSRTAKVQVNVSAINPKKLKEEDLDAEDLLPVLKEEENPLGRVKIAELLSKKVKVGSFKTSEAVYEVIKREANLEAFKVLGSLLGQITRHEVSGKLDKRELLKWYEENRDRLRKEDADAPSPSSSPTVSPAASLPKNAGESQRAKRNRV